MTWIKWLIKTINRSKVWWVYCTGILLVIVGIWIHHYQQPLQTVAELSNFVTEQQTALSLSRGVVTIQKEFYPEFDADGQIEENLIQGGRVLTELNSKLYREDYFIADEQIEFYELLLADVIEENQIPTGFRREEGQRELEKAKYMKAHQLAVIEERVPIDSALFSLQIANVLFSFVTILIILFIFGNQLYQSIQQEKLRLYYTLPIKHRLIVAMDDIRIMYVVLVTIGLFLLSFLPMLISGNFQSLIYPYIAQQGEVVKVFPVWQVILLKLVVWVIALVMLRIIALFLLRIFQSFESQLLFSLLVSGMGVLIMKWDQWQFYNPMSYLLQQNLLLMDESVVMKLGIVSLCLIVFYSALHMSGWMVRLPYQLNRITYNPTDAGYLSRLQSVVSAWVSIEWVKRLKLKVASRLVVVTSILLVLFVGVNSYLALNYTPYVIDSLTEKRIQLNEGIPFSENQKYFFLKSIYQQSGLKAQYEEERQRDETFEEWYAKYDPVVYESIDRELQVIKMLEQLIKESVAELEKDEFTRADFLYYKQQFLDIEPILSSNSSMYAGPNRVTERTYEYNFTYKDLYDRILLEYYEKNQTLPYFEINRFTVPYLKYPKIVFSNFSMQPIDHSVVQMFYRFLQIHGGTIVMALAVIALMSTLADEGYPKAHWLLIATLPRKKSKLYFNKWLYNIITLVGYLVIMIVIMGVLSAIFGGIGDTHYPVLIFDAASIGELEDYIGYDSRFDKFYFHLETIGIYVMKSGLLLVSAVAFLSSLGLLLSNFIRHKVVLYLVFISMIILGYWGNLQNVRSAWRVYSPFIYLNIREIADGWTAHLGNNELFNPITGVKVLWFWTIVLTVIGQAYWYWRTSHVKKEGVLKCR